MRPETDCGPRLRTTAGENIALRTGSTCVSMAAALSIVLSVRTVDNKDKLQE